MFFCLLSFVNDEKVNTRARAHGNWKVIAGKKTRYNSYIFVYCCILSNEHDISYSKLTKFLKHPLTVQVFCSLVIWCTQHTHFISDIIFLFSLQQNQIVKVKNVVHFIFINAVMFLSKKWHNFKITLSTNSITIWIYQMLFAAMIRLDAKHKKKDCFTRVTSLPVRLCEKCMTCRIELVIINVWKYDFSSRYF